MSPSLTQRSRTPGVCHKARPAKQVVLNLHRNQKQQSSFFETVTMCLISCNQKGISKWLRTMKRCHLNLWVTSKPQWSSLNLSFHDQIQHPRPSVPFKASRPEPRDRTDARSVGTLLRQLTWQYWRIYAGSESAPYRILFNLGTSWLYMLCYSSNVGISENLQPCFDRKRIYHPLGRNMTQWPRATMFLFSPPSGSSPCPWRRWRSIISFLPAMCVLLNLPWFFVGLTQVFGTLDESIFLQSLKEFKL